MQILKKFTASIALAGFLFASVVLLLCPQMAMAGNLHGHCTPAAKTMLAGGTQVDAANTGCLQEHVAVFRSLVFVVPDNAQVIGYLTIAVFAVLAALALWRKDINLWEIKSLIKLKLFSHFDKLKNNTQSFLRWLTLVEHADFASC